MNKHKKYSLNNACFCEDIDDSLFILHSNTGQYHELNGSGRFIIKLLDSYALSIDEIYKETKRSAFNIEKESIAKFIQNLLNREIVIFTE